VHQASADLGEKCKDLVRDRFLLELPGVIEDDISTSSPTTRTACAALWKPARSLRRGNPLRRVTIVLPGGGVLRKWMFRTILRRAPVFRVEW
jgi:hypothetical protein